MTKASEKLKFNDRIKVNPVTRPVCTNWWLASQTITEKLDKRASLREGATNARFLNVLST